MRKPAFILTLLMLAIGLIACNRGDSIEPIPIVTPTEVEGEPTPTLVVTDSAEIIDSAEIPTPPPTEATSTPEPIVVEPVATDEPNPPVVESDADWEPQVVYSSPTHGESIVLDGAITIRFDQAMDQASVETAFSIDEGVEGAFVWNRPDEVTFTPLGQLAREQAYTVQIAETARGLNGKALREPLALQFATLGALNISQVIPENGTQNVAVDAAITVLFNRPIVPLVSTGQQADLVQPLTFTPEIAGSGEWVNTSIYRFTPSEPLLAATTYDVGVVDGLQDVVGNGIDESFNSSFRTVSPQVVMVGDGFDTEIAPDETISVTFNMPMSQPETQAATEWQPPVEVSYTWSANGRTVGVTPVERMQLGTNYTLFVREPAMAAVGRAEMGSPSLTQFQTYPFPSVERTSPENGELMDGNSLAWRRGFNFSFVTPMNSDTVVDSLIIEPTPEEVSVTGDGRHFFADFELAYEAVYRITIPSTVEDVYGNAMGEDFVVEFETGTAPPIAAFNLPDSVTQLSRSFPSNINFVYRNLETATVALERYDGALPIGKLALSPLYYNDGNLTGTRVRDWTFEYDPQTVGATEIALADGGALPNGVYRLTVDSPSLTPENSGWQNQDVLVVVAETNLTIKETPDNVHVWATDLDSGQPVAGRELTFYWRLQNGSTAEQFATALTDENGLASVPKSFPRSEFDRYSYDSFIVVQTGQPGEFGFGIGSTGWNTSVATWDLGVNARPAPEAPQTMIMYTDRPLYRPGDTVYIRGWVRENDFGRYSQPAPASIDLTLNSSDFQEGERVLTFELDENGGFYGEWQIPEDAALGGWYFNADNQQFEGVTNREIVVAEFRKPEYLVAVTPVQPEGMRGEDVEVLVSAEFFFGGAAAGLPVEYTIYANPYGIPNGGSGYRFTNPIHNPFDFYFGGGFGLGDYVSGGIGETDVDGNYLITIPQDAIEDQSDGGLQLTIEAKIIDTTGLAVTGNGELVLHPAAVYVGTRPQRTISTVQDGAVIELTTVDWDGNAVADQPVEVVLAKRDWEATPHQINPNSVSWEPIDTEVARMSLRTNGDGDGLATFPLEEGGIYVAFSTVTDADGRTHTSNTTLYVWGDETNWRFDRTDRQMQLTASVDELQVGDSAEILVQAPFAGMNAWLTIERGELIEQRLITLDSTSELLTFEMLPEHAPNVFITIAAVKPKDDSARPVADMRYGAVELQVNPERLLLDVEITPDQAVYGPRDQVAYQIKTTDYLGNGVSAELSLALVDLAILTLKADPMIPLAEALYSPQPLRSQIGAGLFVSGEGIEVEIPNQPLGGGGGGGGGAVAESAVALDREADVDENGEIRDDFRDLAHWEARVTTDENGEATVTVTLPDNLTTWRLNARAVSADTLVGEANHDILATRQLLIRPVTPRFLTVGDRVQMTAAVNNNSPNDIDATVSLEAVGVTLDGDTEQTVSIPAGGSTLVRWPVTVQDTDTVDLIFRVAGGGLSDASRPTVGEIPVYRFNAEDIVATAGVLTDETRRVEAILLPSLVDDSLGDLSVNLSPSLAAAVIDALEASADLPIDWRCSYSLAYRLLPNASSAEMIRTLDLDKPDLLATLDTQNKAYIATLADMQLADGGWDTCRQVESNRWMTAFALHALAAAQTAGESVPTDAIDAALRYVGDATAEIEPTNAENVTTLAYYLYVMSLAGEEVSAEVDALIEAGRDLMTPHAAAMAAMALDNSGAEVPANLLSDLNNSAIVNATGTHWEGGTALSFNSDIRTTAVVVNALAQVDGDNALLPNAVRWLMGARSGRYWSNARDTSWTITALSAWMQASDELNADYNYTLRVNESLLADARFAAKNINSSERVSVPIGDLSTTDVNFLDFQKSGDGNLYYTAYLDAFIDADSVDAVDRGFTIGRAYYDAACEADCEPLTSVASGQEVRVELTIIVDKNRRFVRIEDPLPAGADAIDPNLDISGSGSGVDFGRTEFQRGYWGWWYFNRIEFRDEKVVFTSDYLPAGTYQYSYHLQPIVPGEYQVMPTVATEEFQPEVFGRSSGIRFTITE